MDGATQVCSRMMHGHELDPNNEGKMVPPPSHTLSPPFWENHGKHSASKSKTL